jgi:hypothetical protein
LDRRWIGIDNGVEAIKTALDRFAKGLEPMGDFVEKLKEVERLESEELTLPKLELLQPSMPKPESGMSHRPVREFYLFAAEPYHGCLAQAVAEFDATSTPTT